MNSAGDPRNSVILDFQAYKNDTGARFPISQCGVVREEIPKGLSITRVASVPKRRGGDYWVNVSPDC